MPIKKPITAATPPVPTPCSAQTQAALSSRLLPVFCPFASLASRPPRQIHLALPNKISRPILPLTMDASRASSAAGELRLMRMRLERLKKDVAKATATPLELRIARSIEQARRTASSAAKNNAGKGAARKSRVLKAKPRTTASTKKQQRKGQISGSLFHDNDNHRSGTKSRRERQRQQRRRLPDRPAWGAGSANSTQQVEGATPVYWRRRQAFAKADDVPLEFDPIVVADKKSYGENTAIPGGLEAKKNWHVIEGRGAKEILIKQSDKRLGKAYEYLRQEEEYAGKGGYPGMLPSARNSESGVSARDDDLGEFEDEDDDYSSDPVLTQLRVVDLIDDIYEKKEISDDYHRVRDEPCMSLEEYTESYFRVEFGTAGALNNRRFAAFKRAVLIFYHERSCVQDFADAIGWKDEIPEKENASAGRDGAVNRGNNGNGSNFTNNNNKKVKRSAGGVVLPIPPHRLSDTSLLKSEARRWLSRGRLLLEAQLKMCEAEIASISEETGVTEAALMRRDVDEAENEESAGGESERGEEPERDDDDEEDEAQTLEEEYE